MSGARLINVGLLLAVLALIAAALLLGSARSGGDGESFGGTDAAVTEQLEADGYRPWFAPVFSPGSGEVESGLFAVQAALGGVVLGYCLGALRRRAHPGAGGSGARFAAGRRTPVDPAEAGGPDAAS